MFVFFGSILLILINFLFINSFIISYNRRELIKNFSFSIVKENFNNDKIINKNLEFIHKFKLYTIDFDKNKLYLKSTNNLFISFDIKVESINKNKIYINLEEIYIQYEKDPIILKDQILNQKNFILTDIFDVNNYLIEDKIIDILKIKNIVIY